VSICGQCEHCTDGWCCVHERWESAESDPSEVEVEVEVEMFMERQADWDEERRGWAGL